MTTEDIFKISAFLISQFTIFYGFYSMFAEPKYRILHDPKLGYAVVAQRHVLGRWYGINKRGCKGCSEKASRRVQHKSDYWMPTKVDAEFRKIDAVRCF